MVSYTIRGNVKWSIQSALIDGADNYSFSITLLEACENLNLNFECHSQEALIGFQEHILIIDGKVIHNYCSDYYEI